MPADIKSVVADAKFQALRTQINGLNIYQHLTDTTDYTADGICYQKFWTPLGTIRLKTSC